MKCALSSKSPKVQILGSDLKVHGDISTSLTDTKAGDGAFKTFGSWVEYGVFSTGDNKIASSGAGLSNGNINSSRDEWSKLTFANKVAQQTDAFGKYQPLQPGDANVVFDTARMASTAPFDPAASDIAAGVYDYTGSPTLGDNLDIGQSEKGTSIIIRVHGTVTINNNIDVNNNARGSIQDISQVVIVADNIIINGNVTNIDAWLLTRSGGSINTCGDVPVAANLTTSTCPNQLTVNGAVITSRLYLRRTAGSEGDDPGKAAEIFRLRPDAQLWAYNYANKGDRAQTVYVTELPPRF
jgi:hypothetical protein